jgi:hypothetical protein
MAIATANQHKDILMPFITLDYIKMTADYGISFSSCENDALESFITFPLNDTEPTRPAPTVLPMPTGDLKMPQSHP